MATAKKLPSGNWRVQVFSHTDANGKKVIESFTASTKEEANLWASEFAAKKKRRKTFNLTVYEAIEGYINAKENVLSPSTIRAYRIQLRNNYSTIANTSIKKLTNEQLQIFVSALTEYVTPKSVANIYGLLSSALRFYMPDAVFHVTLPKRAKKRKNAPSDEDIQKLFNIAPPELKKCIALGAFTSMRRGEICALTYGDMEDHIIHVTKDIVQGFDKKWYIKDLPKTEDSYRDCYVPDNVLKLLGSGEKSERIIKYKNPTSVTRVFTRIRDSLGLNVCFHDLRHYYASIGAVLGIPDNYLADFGGWKRGSNVMKSVYQNSIKDKSESYAEKMAEHFNKLI